MNENVVLDEVLKMCVHPKYTCSTCNREVKDNYPSNCPNCGKCFHFMNFGSDNRCSCGKKHYWFGEGWLDVNEKGETVWPEEYFSSEEKVTNKSQDVEKGSSSGDAYVNWKAVNREI